MIDHKTGTILAPGVAAIVIEFRNDGDLPPVVTVENLDGSASSAIKFQESDDGSTWSDIAGTTATVNPGTSNVQLLSGATRRKVALFAGGNVSLLVTVTRQIDGQLGDYGNIM